MEPHTHRLVVPRTARYVTVGEPDDEELRQVWFLLHGYGQLAAGFVERASALAGPGRLLVAPEGLSRFYHEDHRKVGASWMTREDRESEMTDYLRYLDLLHGTIFGVAERSEVTLGLLGFSQGVATAARWAVRGRARIDRLVLWGQGLPPELSSEDLEKMKAMRLALVSGTRDELFPESERREQVARLDAAAVAYESLSFDGGHRLDDDTLRAL